MKACWVVKQADLNRARMPLPRIQTSRARGVEIEFLGWFDGSMVGVCSPSIQIVLETFVLVRALHF
jgi:hypothetical protein